MSLYSPTFHLPYGAGTAGERMVSGGEGVGYGDRDADVRGEQTQGYEAKRVRG